MNDSAFPLEDEGISEQEEGKHTRRCIVERVVLPTECMVRFVAAPDGIITPDVGRKLPGRGIWLSARQDVLHKAIESRLFARAARQAVAVPDDLESRVEMLLARRCLQMLGMARRAGKAVSGFEKVDQALETGRTGMVFLARDAAPDSAAKLRYKAKDIPLSEGLTGEELGGVFGRFPCVYVAIAKSTFARDLAIEAARLSGFRLTKASLPADQQKIGGNGVRKDG